MYKVRKEFQTQKANYILLVVIFMSSLLSFGILFLKSPIHYSFDLKRLDQFKNYNHVWFDFGLDNPISNAMEVKDLNEDGKQETIVAFAGFSSEIEAQAVTIHLWKEDEELTIFSIRSLSTPSLTIGQFDLDPELEIILGIHTRYYNPTSQRSFYLLDATSPSLDEWIATPVDPLGFTVQAFLALDYNHNSLDDLVVAFVNESQISLELFLDGDFENSTIIDKNPLNQITMLEKVDIDSDNDVEIIVGGSERVLMYDFENGYWEQSIITEIPSFCTTSGIKIIKLKEGATGLVITVYGSRTFYGQPMIGVYQWNTNQWIEVFQSESNLPFTTLETSDIDRDGLKEIITAQSVSSYESKIIIYKWDYKKQSLIQEYRIKLSEDYGEVWEIKESETRLYVMSTNHFFQVIRVNDTISHLIGLFFELGIYSTVMFTFIGCLWNKIHRLALSDAQNSIILFVMNLIIVGVLDFVFLVFKLEREIFILFSFISNTFLAIGCGFFVLTELRRLLQQRKDKIFQWLFLIMTSSFLLLLPIKAFYHVNTDFSPIKGIAGFEITISGGILGFFYAITTLVILIWAVSLGYYVFSQWAEFTNEKLIYSLRAFFLLQIFFFGGWLSFFGGLWIIDRYFPSTKNFLGSILAQILVILIQVAIISSLFVLIQIYQLMFVQGVEKYTSLNSKYLMTLLVIIGSLSLVLFTPFIGIPYIGGVIAISLLIFALVTLFHTIKQMFLDKTIRISLNQWGLLGPLLILLFLLILMIFPITSSVLDLMPYTALSRFSIFFPILILFGILVWIVSIPALSRISSRQSELVRSLLHPSFHGPIVLIILIAFMRFYPIINTGFFNFWTDVDFYFLLTYVAYIVRLDEVRFLVFSGVGIGFLYMGWKINQEIEDFSSIAIGLGYFCWAIPSWFSKLLGVVLILWGFIIATEPRFLEKIRKSYRGFIKNYIDTIVDLSDAQDYSQKMSLATQAFAEFAKHMEEKKHIRLDLPQAVIESYVQEALEFMNQVGTGGVTR